MLMMQSSTPTTAYRSANAGPCLLLQLDLARQLLDDALKLTEALQELLFARPASSTTVTPPLTALMWHG